MALRIINAGVYPASERNYPTNKGYVVGFMFGVGGDIQQRQLWAPTREIGERLVAEAKQRVAALQGAA